MRISDWSSDVCSSDLCTAAAKACEAFVFKLSIFSMQVPNLCVEQEALGGSIGAFQFAAIDLQMTCVQNREQDLRWYGTRKSVVSGKSVSDGVDLGVRRIFKKATLQLELLPGKS